MRTTTLAALRAQGAVETDTAGLELLCSLSPQPDRRRAMVESELERGCYRLEWCRLAMDEAGQPLAAQAWWARPSTDTPVLVDLLGATDVDAAAALLTDALNELDLQTAQSWLSVRGTDGGPVGQAFPIEVPALEVAGFRPAVDRVRLEWTPTDGQAAASHRLRFRPARECTDQQLLDLFVAVGADSLDFHMRDDQVRLGAEAEARHRLDRTAAMSGAADWFAIGVDHDGAAVGYVRVARVNNDLPVLAELGVARPMRGRGYVDDLLAHGTRLLAADGADQIHADTDLGNAPMRAAFQRAGYREFARRYDFRWQRPA